VRECGNCTLCCTLLGVHALQKKANEDCIHCDVGIGCKIYNTRPKECSDFDCLWLAGHAPDYLKPSKTHVVLSSLKRDLEKMGLSTDNNMILVYPDPNYPDAHKKGDMRMFLNDLLAHGVELIIIAGGQKLFMKWGTVDG